MTSALTQTFLNTYNMIDRHLRLLVETDRRDGFYAVVGRAARSDSAVRTLAVELKEFADLRNAIVHERTDSHPIAEPFQGTVERFVRISLILTSPPQALTVAERDVVAVEPQEPVGTAAALMRERGFSQVPVIGTDGYEGLLTAATIAYWLSDRLAGEMDILEEEPVSQVLRFTEDSDRHAVFLPRSANVFDALGCFADAYRGGWVVDALLITEAGQRRQGILGILSAWDLAALHRAVTP